MRRALVLIVLGAGLVGCTLNRAEENKIVVTATLSNTLAAVQSSPIPTQIEASPTPALTNTIEPTFPPLPTSIPATATIEPTATIPLSTSTPVPTRTPAGPPTVLPLDDGSGILIPDTGSSSALAAAGIETLPESLYYLSDHGDQAQVWRLRYGLTVPEQLTSDSSGVTLYDVASDGTLAYVTSGGNLVIGGVPFGLPAQGVQVTSLAWSPAGDWLAYTLRSDPPPTGAEPVDGLWLQNRNREASLLAPSVYTDDVRIYTGPLDWRPDGTELLVGHELDEDRSYSRASLTAWTVTPVWNADTLRPESYEFARWSINGNAIIASGGDQVMRIEPDTLGVAVLVGSNAGLSPYGAQQFANGTLIFAGGQQDSSLYLLADGQPAPQSITRPLTTSGRVEFLWDNLGQQVLIVVYESPGIPLGTAYLRDTAGELVDLTALLGAVGAPQWGPVFRAGDRARIQTTQGDSLNVRDGPGGSVLIQLANGTQVTVLGGPRWYDGSRWWRIQTADGIVGWAVESVTDSRGLPLRTLVPLG